MIERLSTVDLVELAVESTDCTRTSALLRLDARPLSERGQLRRAAATHQRLSYRQLVDACEHRVHH
jgi:hypothetical protein